MDRCCLSRCSRNGLTLPPTHAWVTRSAGRTALICVKTGCQYRAGQPVRNVNILLHKQAHAARSAKLLIPASGGGGHRARSIRPDSLVTVPKRSLELHPHRQHSIACDNAGIPDLAPPVGVFVPVRIDHEILAHRPRRLGTDRRSSDSPSAESISRLTSVKRRL